MPMGLGFQLRWLQAWIRVRYHWDCNSSSDATGGSARQETAPWQADKRRLYGIGSVDSVHLPKDEDDEMIWLRPGSLQVLLMSVRKRYHAAR